MQKWPPLLARVPKRRVGVRARKNASNSGRNLEIRTYTSDKVVNSERIWYTKESMTEFKTPGGSINNSQT